MNHSLNPLMPREKLLTQGADQLSDHELLAIFLRTGIKGTSVLELSQQVLSHFGSLRGLLMASEEAFCQVKGLGQTQYVLLQAARTLMKRFLRETLHEPDAVDSPEVAIRYFQAELGDWEQEVFMALFLDNQNRLIAAEKLFFGTVNQVGAYPREVIKAAIKHNAAGILVAHNHPSGLCTPSVPDREFTEKLEKICDLIDLRFVDHIIVGKGDYFSFDEEKFMIGLGLEEEELQKLRHARDMGELPHPDPDFVPVRI